MCAIDSFDPRTIYVYSILDEKMIYCRLEDDVLQQYVCKSKSHTFSTVMTPVRKIRFSPLNAKMIWIDLLRYACLKYSIEKKER